MKRKPNRLVTALVLLLTLGLVCGSGLCRADATPPNILFVLTDDMGWGDLGVFYQNSRGFATNRAAPAFLTPHLDTLAAEGTQLRRHYCDAPVCAPARASFLLGVHQGHANVRDNQFDKALENNHTLGTVLRRAGYRTALIGKYGLDGGSSGVPGPAHPQNRGFDYFFGYLEHLDAHYHYPKEFSQNLYDGFTEITPALDKCYSTDLWTARAKRWITDHVATNAAAPFFLLLAYTAPHARLEVPTMAYPPGGGVSGGVQWLGIPGAMINTASNTVDSWIHPDYTNATYDHDNNPATAEVAWPDYAKRYATMMRRLDDALADLVQTLKDLNLDTNTLLLFTSDNGPHNEAGAGGSFTYNPTFFDSFGPMDGIKRDSWEAGIRVPTFARWPGVIPDGRISHQPSQFHDWMATFAALAGVPVPARSDGVSLVPTLTGVGTQRPGLVYVEYYVSGSTPNYTEFEPAHRAATRNQQQVVYLDGFKGVRYNVTASTDHFLIYNTLTDAKEGTDLAGTSPFFTSLQQQMKDRVLQVRRPGGGVSRPYDSTPVPSVVISNLVPGLEFSAFEGEFPWVPDFTELNPVTNGVCAGPDLAVRTRDHHIGLWFGGYLRVPADGTYTFSLTTDARAFLRLHDAALIDADFEYVSGTERSASIALRAGDHPLRLAYARGTNGTPSLSLQWSGPGIPKQPIPPENLLRIQTPGTNQSPTAVDDTARTRQNAAVTIDVLANDTPGSGPGPLRVVQVGTPLAGSATTNLAGQVVYTPNPGFLGEDQFAYIISDGLGTATATVRLKVFFEDGLIWFPLNQTSGLSTEDASGGFTGNLSGFTNDPAQWVAGRWNRALAFGGAGQFLTIPGFTGILAASNRTCAAWVKTTSSGQLPVIAWGPNATGNKWTFLLQNGHARIEITSGYVEGTRLVNDGQWHHVAVSFANDGTPDILDAGLYVDGTEETTFTTSLSRTVNTTASGDVKIGSDVQNRFFSGVIDEPRIYNRALSGAEIAALYAAGHQSAAAWQRRYFGNAPVDWTADDDADGGARLLEYAFGTEPWIPTTGAFVISGWLAGDRLNVSFPRRVPGTSELLYTLRVSRDLLAWDQLQASLVQTLPLNDQPGLERATYQTDATLPEEAAQFVRLRVTLP